MSERKEKPKGKSSKDHTPSKSIKPSKSSKPSKAKALTIGGQNVESLLAEGKDKKKKKDKVNEVKTLIEKFSIDIFVLGETWIPSKEHKKDLEELKSRLAISLPNLSKFDMIRQDRTYHKTDRSYGGLIVYIRESVTFTVDSFWEWPVNNTQFLEISVTKPSRFDLVAIYSPPRDNHTLYVKTLMKYFLERNKSPLIPIMFVGDINIDFTRDKKKEHVVELEKLLKDHKARSLINKPTNNAKTESNTHTAKPKSKQRSKKTKNASPKPYCIDHIITNISSEHIITNLTGVFHSSKEISEHSLVYCRVSELPSVHDERTKAVEVISVCQLKNDTKEVSLLDSLPVLVKASNRCVLTLLNEVDNLNTVKGIVEEVQLTAPVQQLEIGVSIRVERVDEEEIPKLKSIMQRFQKPVRCTLAIRLDNPPSVNPTKETLSIQVGGFDCFLLKCLPADMAIVENHLLSKYFVCSEANNDDCYKLFNTKEKLTKHWTQDHNKCPDPLDQSRGPSKNPRKRIEPKYPHFNYICRAPNCNKDNFHTREERNKHECTEHHMCFWCDLVFADVAALDEHRDGTHMKCTYCDKPHKNQAGVNIHISKTPLCEAKQSRALWINSKQKK